MLQFRVWPVGGQSMIELKWWKTFENGHFSPKQKYVLPETRHCLHGNCKAESSRRIETISYLVNQCMVEGNQNGNIMTFPSRQ